MDTRRFLQSIRSSDRVEAIALSSIDGRSEREKGIRDFIAKFGGISGKEIIVAIVVKQ